MYNPFDQHEKLEEPPWSDHALAAREAVHGHDVCLKCYPKFGCRLSFVNVEDAIEMLDAIADYAERIFDDHLHLLSRAIEMLGGCLSEICYNAH